MQEKILNSTVAIDEFANNYEMSRVARVIHLSTIPSPPPSHQLLRYTDLTLKTKYRIVMIPG